MLQLNHGSVASISNRTMNWLISSNNNDSIDKEIHSVVVDSTTSSSRMKINDDSTSNSIFPKNYKEIMSVTTEERSS